MNFKLAKIAVGIALGLGMLSAATVQAGGGIGDCSTNTDKGFVAFCQGLEQKYCTGAESGKIGLVKGVTLWEKDPYEKKALWVGPEDVETSYAVDDFEKIQFITKTKKTVFKITLPQKDDFTDKVTSICVPAGFTLIAYEHADFKGDFCTIKATDKDILIPDLKDYTCAEPADHQGQTDAGDKGKWNDIISSIKVTRQQ